MPDLIAFEQVVAGYGSLVILNGLTFQARAGEITLLIGPNGAGKSTVLKTLFGIDKPIIGVIHLAPLPGAPRYAGQPDREIYAAGVRDARTLAQGGVDRRPRLSRRLRHGPRAVRRPVPGAAAVRPRPDADLPYGQTREFLRVAHPTLLGQ